jgi:hypothetical protein
LSCSCLFNTSLSILSLSPAMLLALLPFLIHPVSWPCLALGFPASPYQSYLSFLSCHWLSCLSLSVLSLNPVLLFPLQSFLIHLFS